MEPAPRGKVTGVYGGDRVPGAYMKTLTGVVRGEELFSRPDLERPWRTGERQRSAAAVALKEKEIEELMRLCSNLRTELGNAKSDARFLEYAVTEKTKMQLAEKQSEVQALRERVEQLEKEKRDMTEAAESQARLLRSQAENESMTAKAEARLATERCVELAKMYQRQIADVKAAGVREVEFVESQFKARVGELATEVKSVRETSRAAEEHLKEQVAQSQNMVHRVETDYKERLRSSEQRVEDQRREHETQLEKERHAKEAALADARRTTEKLTYALADKHDAVQKQKLWNSFLLSHLDTFYHNFITTAPDAAVEPSTAPLLQLPELYAPNSLLEEPEAKVAVERVVYRLAQLKQLNAVAGGGDEEPAAITQPPSAAQLDHVAEVQDRLRRAIYELEERHGELDATVSSVAARLYFFSDNLEASLRSSTHHPVVAPPVRDVVFVCLSVSNGRVLWAADVEAMRSSVQLLYGTLRSKMAEYGGYECYSDDVAMLLAFADGTAACRFCAESQEWLLQLPWPSSLLQLPGAQEERSPAGRVIYRGLRVSMALHAGDAFVELSGVPMHGTYRNHYYGRAVSQLMHIGALTQGGQILASAAAWSLCLRRKHELGAVTAKSLGTVPVASLNSISGHQEKHNLELLQIVPTELEDRTFKPVDKIGTAASPVSALSGVKTAALSAEVASIAAQRERIRDALALLHGECNGIRSEIANLVELARTTQPHFHILPPSEMVAQMNDLYNVMEKVSIRAEELYGDLQEVAHTQEELETHTSSLREHLAQQEAAAAREEDLRMETEAVRQRLERQLQMHREKHRFEVDRLQQAIQEKEQLLRKLYTDPRAM